MFLPTSLLSSGLFSLSISFLKNIYRASRLMNLCSNIEVSCKGGNPIAKCGSNNELVLLWCPTAFPKYVQLHSTKYPEAWRWQPLFKRQWGKSSPNLRGERNWTQFSYIQCLCPDLQVQNKGRASPVLCSQYNSRAISES